ncbi:hypothetical protein VINE108274_19930 [Vibrio neptunius]
MRILDIVVIVWLSFLTLYQFNTLFQLFVDGWL